MPGIIYSVSLHCPFWSGNGNGNGRRPIRSVPKEKCIAKVESGVDKGGGHFAAPMPLSPSDMLYVFKERRMGKASDSQPGVLVPLVIREHIAGGIRCKIHQAFINQKSKKGTIKQQDGKD
ncbi:hypothetical protein AMECASPLE_008881 [Ameca splendens]|uniref:Uncharacterized protein n=1 Tax=Ameca splendens TaxID=208324 RepID=A0ABV0YYN3_9TELE